MLIYDLPFVNMVYKTKFAKSVNNIFIYMKPKNSISRKFFRLKDIKKYYAIA